MPWNEVHIKLDDIGAKCVCPHCQRTFSKKSGLDRHIENQICLKPKLSKREALELANTAIATMNATNASNDLKFKQLEDQVAKLTATQQTVANLATSLMIPSVNNQNLNIVCLGSKDNLLDILSSIDGLPNALTYLKGCALARLAGDCRILERVYKLDTAQAAIMYANKSKTKFVYYDERQRRMVEGKEVMAKKLTDILQRSYLKGMGSFRTDILENQRDDYHECVDMVNMPELDPYDVQIWNAHIHELADDKYQKKVLKNLKIPTEPSRE